MRNCVSQRLPTHCSSRTPTIYFKGTTFRGATPQESRQFHACGCHAAPRPSELSSGPVLSHAAVEVPGPRAQAGPGVCGTAQNTDPSARGQSVSPRTRPYLRSSNPPRSHSSERRFHTVPHTGRAASCPRFTARRPPASLERGLNGEAHPWPLPSGPRSWLPGAPAHPLSPPRHPPPRPVAGTCCWAARRSWCASRWRGRRWPSACLTRRSPSPRRPPWTSGVPVPAVIRRCHTRSEGVFSPRMRTFRTPPRRAPGPSSSPQSSLR